MKQFKHKTLLARASMMLIAMLCFLGGARAQSQTFDFEDSQIPSGWTNDQNYPWVVVTDAPTGFNGTYCIKSSNSGVGSSTSSIEFTFNFTAAGTISFRGGCWGEGTSSVWDKCLFFIDGTEKLRKGALASWDYYSFEVEAGEHTFKWSYSKDGSVDPTIDAFFVDDVTIRIGLFPSPTDLMVTDITKNSAKVSWTAPESSGITGYTYQYKKASEDSWISDETTTTSVTLNGLTSGTTYNFQVKTQYNSEYSDWATTNFTTDCDVITTYPWSENFDGYTVASAYTPTARTLPVCWNAINTSTYSSYAVYPSIYNYGSSPNCLRMYSAYSSYSDYDPQDQYVILPAMENLNGKQITLKVKGNAATSTFKIGMMTDPTDVSTFSVIATQEGLTTSYQDFEYILSGSGNYVAIMIEAATSGRTGNGIYIDDIVIREAPTCIKPTAFEAISDAQTVLLSWTSDASEWQVAHSTDATATPDECIVGTTTDKSYEMNNLSLNTDHYFWVRTYCSESEQSDWVGPVSVHIGYCTPNPSSRDGKGITKVSFGIGDNPVNNVDETNGLPATAPYYGNYTSMIGSLQAGVESTVAITYATGSSTVYSYGTIIWVDWDNSLTFEDDEIVYTGTSVQGSGGTPQVLEASFTVPADQALGDYRMRIAGADSYFDSYIGGSATANHSPCFSASYAVCHDYTLRVLEAPSCLTPTGLAVTTDGQTATATWEGTASLYNIDINGTVTENVSNPYTFDVDLSTTYTVKVQANCGGGDTSDWSDSYSFTTPDCIGGRVIEYTLNDSYGDGWDGASISVVEGCGNIVETLTVSAASNSGTLTLCGNYFEFIWNSGSYDGECSFTFTENGTTLFTKPSSISDGLVLYTIGTNTNPTGLTAGTPGYNNVDLSWTENGTATAWEICINGDESNLVPANTNVNFNLTGLLPDNSYIIKVRAVSGDGFSCWSNEVTVTTPVACERPTDLTETNITFTTADLSWAGTSDSYVAEYGAWTQVGTDQIATGTMTSYPFDLSGFSGKGTIAIRHYNVNDQFYLNVDDIVVRDTNGDIVYSENFESGSIPASMSNIDLDGDGYAWTIGSVGQLNANGSYCVYSASWLSGTVLYPDNWLVISDITLGGSITFNACGQDPSAPAEVFGVYVIADNQFTQASSGTETSCKVTGLTEGTAYAWRVQGDCGEYQSNWVFSLFKTPDNLLVFATDGNWNTLSNWTDIDGNAATALPTVENKVRIDADATIPAGVVATAKNATLNGGSITIEDGGQLKQGGSVYVTMYKGITGYGAGNEEDADHYNLIATPHNCSWLEQNSTFPYVLNLTDGEYDLYAFDSTVEQEWINYDSNSDHSEFHTGQNYGLFNKKGYLYANAENKDLEFIGTVMSSLDNTLTESYTYNASSTDPFNGWKLIGNPFSCNALISYSGDATFYMMNATGDGFEAFENPIKLTPGEGAFMVVSESGTISYNSEVPNGFSNTSTTAAVLLPLLPLHGLDTNQDANLSAAITFAKEGYATYYNGVYDVVLPAGMLAHVVTAGGTSLTYDGVANGGTEENVVPAGTAVLLQVEATGSEQTLPIYLATPSAAAYTGTNFLFGSDEATETTGGAKFYMLSYNSDNQNIGWYYGAENGAPFTSLAHKAWLALPASAPTFLGLPDWEDTSGIVPVGVNPEDGEWYTLQGLKIGKKPTTKGVYIHNGKKVLIP